MQLWKRIAVTIAIKNRIVGGIPTNPNLIKGWIAASMPDVAEAEREKLAAKTAQELPAAVEEASKAMWTTFKVDTTGLYIENRQVKAMFKESANILRDMLVKADKRAKGEGKSRFTNLKSKLAERLFVEEEKIYLFRNDKPIAKPDGSEERAIHVITAMGPRTALKRVDYVQAPATIKFNLRLLDDGVIDTELVKVLLEHSSYNGLGTDRSQGNGLFEVLDVVELG